MARQEREQSQITQVNNDFETFLLPFDASLNLESRTTYGTTDPAVDLSMVNVEYVRDFIKSFRGLWQANPETLQQPIGYIADDIVLDSNDSHFYQLTGTASATRPSMDTANWTQLSQQDDLGASLFNTTDQYRAGNLVYRGPNSPSDSTSGQLFVFVGTSPQTGTQAPLPTTRTNGLLADSNWLQVGGSITEKQQNRIDQTKFFTVADGTARAALTADDHVSTGDIVYEDSSSIFFKVRVDSGGSINYDPFAVTEVITLSTTGQNVSDGDLVVNGPNVYLATARSTGVTSGTDASAYGGIHLNVSAADTLSAETSITNNAAEITLTDGAGNTTSDVTLIGAHGVEVEVDTADDNITIGYGVPPFNDMITYSAGNLVRNSSGSIFEALGPVPIGSSLANTALWLQLSAGTTSPRTAKNQFFSVNDDADEAATGNFQVGDVIYNIDRSRFDQVTGIDSSGNVTDRDFINVTEYIVAGTDGQPVEPGDIVLIGTELHLATSAASGFTSTTPIPSDWLNLSANAQTVTTSVSDGDDPTLTLTHGTQTDDIDFVGEGGVEVTGNAADESLSFDYGVPEWDTTADYITGNLVVDGDALYRALTDITGSSGGATQHITSSQIRYTTSAVDNNIVFLRFTFVADQTVMDGTYRFSLNDTANNNTLSGTFMGTDIRNDGSGDPIGVGNAARRWLIRTTDITLTSGTLPTNYVDYGTNNGDIQLGTGVNNLHPAVDPTNWEPLTGSGTTSPRSELTKIFTVQTRADRQALRGMKVGDMVYVIDHREWVIVTDIGGGTDPDAISGQDFLNVTEYVQSTTTPTDIAEGDLVLHNGTLYLATSGTTNFTSSSTVGPGSPWINLTAHAAAVDLEATAGTNPSLRVSQGSANHDLGLIGGHGVTITGTASTTTEDPTVTFDYRVLPHDPNLAYNAGNLVRDTNGQIYEAVLAVPASMNIPLNGQDSNGDNYWLQLSTGSNTGLTYDLEVRTFAGAPPQIVLNPSFGSDDRVPMMAGTALSVAGDVNADSITYSHADITHTDSTGTPSTLGFGDTVTPVTAVTVDDQGHTTEVETTVFTLPSNTFGAADATDAGTAGLVPAPAAGQQNRFLRGDATWAEADVDANDTRISEWNSTDDYVTGGGYADDQLTRVGSRLFVSNTDSNTTNPYEVLPLGSALPVLTSTQLTITLLRAHPTHPDNDSQEPHYTYALLFNSGSDEHTATFRGRDVQYDRANQPLVWTVPRSDVTFTPPLTGGNVDGVDPVAAFTAQSDQWDDLGGGGGAGTTVATADVNLGIFQENMVVSGSGDNLNFIGLDAFSGFNNGRGIRGVTFNTATDRYDIDFREPFPDLMISASPAPLSFNIGDTIPATSDFVLTFSGGNGGPYNVVDTLNATPAFNLGGVTSPQTVTLDTSSLDGNTAIGLTSLATARVDDAIQTTSASVDLQYRVVDNRAVRLRVLSPQNRGVTELNQTGSTVEFELTSTNLDLRTAATTTTLAFSLGGTTVTPTINNRTENRLTLTLPGTMFIPNASYTLTATATDTRFTGADAIPPATATYTSDENRAFQAIIGDTDPVTRSNLDMSAERFNLSLANLDLSNADTNISAITIDNVDISSFYTLEPDNIHITIPPDQWSTLAGTDILRVTITDNSITRDTFSQAQQISVEVFEPYFDGVTETTPTAPQITAFRGQERNFVIGGDNPSTFRVGQGVVGHNVYLVVPSRFTSFALVNTVTNVPTDPVSVGNVNFQHADPDQGNVQYTIWLVGTYQGPIEFRVVNA